jgi:hypothetical protein
LKLIELASANLVGAIFRGRDSILDVGWFRARSAVARRIAD